ncbi:MAG: isoaspartyl peptidase/L-asparaginase family protein [Chitinophagales bacterium]
MKNIFFSLIIILLLSNCSSPTETENKKTNQFALAIHGGAGALAKGNYTPEQEAAYLQKLNEALALGYSMLTNGDSAVAVVEAVIKVLEDSPLFNSGKGSVITSNGKIKMDASIMNGRNLDAGSVSNVQTIKNPISAARKVMEKEKYIMISGEGAEFFAKSSGLEIVDPNYFYTQHQYLRWKGMKDSTEINAIRYVDSIIGLHPIEASLPVIEKDYGTVGCVVLDKYGNLAAGTSTGGLMNKRYDRIGDSPVIGAGTYADNNTCAISCTGTGEDFIKTNAAKTVADLIEFKGMTLKEATNEMIHVRFKPINGDGGMIAIDNMGNISFQFNSDGMFRGYADEKGKIETFIYKDE